MNLPGSEQPDDSSWSTVRELKEEVGYEDVKVQESSGMSAPMTSFWLALIGRVCE